MATPVATYDAKEVLVTIGGFPITGFDEDEFISVERDADSFTKKSGADGEVARALTNNQMGTLTLTLLQTSKANAFLTGLVVADEVTGDGVAPILITDKRGGSTIFSAEGWVRKPANQSYAAEVGNRQWLIDLARVDVLNVGN